MGISAAARAGRTGEAGMPLPRMIDLPHGRPFNRPGRFRARQRMSFVSVSKWIKARQVTVQTSATRESPMCRRFRLYCQTASKTNLLVLLHLSCSLQPLSTVRCVVFTCGDALPRSRKGQLAHRRQNALWPGYNNCGEANDFSLTFSRSGRGQEGRSSDGPLLGYPRQGRKGSRAAGPRWPPRWSGLNPSSSRY